jgi:Predicted transcriptional regulator
VSIPKVLPDELVVRNLYPAIRALIATELVRKYKFKQQDAAARLGVSQAAISYYLSQKRGAAQSFIKSEFVKKSIDKFAEGIAMNKITEEELVIGLTKLIDYILSNRELCELHKKIERNLDVDKCHICEERFKISAEIYVKNLINKIEKDS